MLIHTILTPYQLTAIKRRISQQTTLELIFGILKLPIKVLVSFPEVYYIYMISQPQTIIIYNVHGGNTNFAIFAGDRDGTA